jgi:hypothetical protein
MTDSKKNDGEKDRDDLQLEVEEVADLEVPKAVADDVRGASGTPAQGKVVGKQNC